MIKRTIIGMMALALSLCASAQVLLDDDDQPTVNSGANFVSKSYVLSIGPKVGINYSLASNPTEFPELNVKGNMGYSAGAAVNVRFARPAGKPVGTERFGVQLEALYSMHSIKTDYDNINLTAFEMPLLFQWYALPNLCIEVGPTLFANFSASPDNIAYTTETKVSTATSETVTTHNVNIPTGKIKQTDLMLSIGVGYKHKSGFTASLRYNLANTALAENFDTKVSTVSVGIGWLFSIVK